MRRKVLANSVEVSVQEFHEAAVLKRSALAELRCERHLAPEPHYVIDSFHITIAVFSCRLSLARSLYCSSRGRGTLLESHELNSKYGGLSRKLGTHNRLPAVGVRTPGGGGQHIRGLYEVSWPACTVRG